MDWHEAALGLLAILLGIVGFMSSRLFQKFDEMEERLTDFRDDMSDKFLRRDDYRKDIEHVMRMLDKIFDRLEDKVDKP